MGLQTAFHTAKSALLTSSTQTQVVSRNISGASDPGYARRVTLVETLYDGGSRVAGIRSATDAALQEADLSATAQAGAEGAVAAALGRLHATIGDPQQEGSPAALIGALQNALARAVAQPADPLAARNAVGAADRLARSLNAATQATQSVRADADRQMSEGVARINELLADFDRVNTQIVRGTASGANVNDALDRRNALLKDLSGYVGVSTLTGKNGDMAIYADGGATLYQGGARSVTMAPTSTFAPGVNAAAVYIDGVAVTGPTAAMPLRTGALAGLARVRDETAPAFQAQLDEIARGVVDAFAETSASAPDRTGLFAWPGGPALPASSQAVGLAGAIGIDAAVDPNAGGDARLLRDGGIGGAAYVYNATGAAGYSDRLSALSQAMAAQRTFNPSAGLSGAATLAEFAEQSAGWLEAGRQAATQSNAAAQALAEQAGAALSNATGVNIDDQMAQMLQLERSFQAAAKMIATIDQMYSSFFESVR